MAIVTGGIDVVAFGTLSLLCTLAFPTQAQSSRQPQPSRPSELAAGVTQHGDSVTVRLIDADLRAVVQTLAPYLDRPIVSGIATAVRVTLQTPQPIARGDIPRLLVGILESQSYELVVDSTAGIYRVRAREAVRANANVPPAPNGGNATTDALQFYVIRLRHAHAADVAATVNALYGRASALGESSIRGAGATLNQDLRQNALPAQLPAQSQPSAGAGIPTPRVAALSGETTIIPDAATNALLIRASRQDFELIQTAVKELDTRPLQVLIEILIAEVRRDSRFALGVGTGVPGTTIRGSSSLNGVTIGGVTANGPAGDSTLGDFVLRVMHVGGSVNFSATLIAAEGRGEARILSRPIVIAANNETAEILVGSQRPFVQAQRSLATNDATRDQFVQYKDVGTKLTVRPTISADGYVALAVTQEVNQATTEVQFDAPVISTRTVQTKLVVRDSQTVILGGLSDRQRDASRTGIPYLSRIPLIGWLFGRTTRQDSETEFFLFITPRIIRSDEDAAAVTRPREQAIDRGKP